MKTEAFFDYTHKQVDFLWTLGCLDANPVSPHYNVCVNNLNFTYKHRCDVYCLF